MPRFTDAWLSSGILAAVPSRENAAVRGAILATLSTRLCTPGTGVNLWGASPLYENHSSTSTSPRQGRKGDRPSGGSLAANVRADGQKPHTRLSPRASQHHMTKPTGSGDRVNAAVVHGKFTFLSGEICATCDRIVMSRIREGSTRQTRPRRISLLSLDTSPSRETRIRQHLTANPYSAVCMETVTGERAEVSRRHSSSEFIGTKARTRKGGRAFHKLRDGDESDTDEPYPGALWRDSPLE